MTIPEHYMREADHVENIAKSISLLSDKRALLAEAEFLRRRAQQMEVQSFDGEAAEASPAPTPGPTL